MSSINPLDSYQDIEILAYHTKIETLLHKLEQDITALEAHFRTGHSKSKSNFTTLTHPSSTPAYTPTAPHLPSLTQYPAFNTNMQRPYSPPLYTPSVPSMPAMYIPSFPLQVEAFRDRAREMEIGESNLDAMGGDGGGDVDRDGDEEVYDPANPIMDVDARTKASRPYDLERYLRRSGGILVERSDSGLRTEGGNRSVKGPKRKASEVEDEGEAPECVDDDKVPECIDDEIGYSDSDEEEAIQITEPVHPRAQHKVQQRTQNQEDKQKETIESDNPSTEKFWAQIFSENNQMEMGGRHVESGEHPSAETLLKHAYSPFERSPAPDIVSPGADMRTEHKGEYPDTTEKYWSAPPPQLEDGFVGISGNGSGSGGARKEDDEWGPCEGEAEIQDTMDPHGEERVWSGSPEGMDIVRDSTMQDQVDEYEYDFEPPFENEGEDRQDLFEEEDDEEVDYMDSE